jgi:Zn-dependent peptidase ImmA (M78 family)
MDSLITRLTRKHQTNDPFIIARNINIHIRFTELDDGTRGFYYKKLRRRFIVIHEGLDEYWQRFVCAHELGHDRLHPGFSGFWLDKHTFFNPGKYERQANRFAVRLLTAGDQLEYGETLEEFFRRNNIPDIMHEFY